MLSSLKLFTHNIPLISKTFKDFLSPEEYAKLLSETLDFAIMHEQWYVIDRLMNHGAEITNFYLEIILRAEFSGKDNLLRKILDQYPNITRAYFELAIRNKDLEIIELFLRNGVKFNSNDCHLIVYELKDLRLSNFLLKLGFISIDYIPKFHVLLHENYKQLKSINYADPILLNDLFEGYQLFLQQMQAELGDAFINQKIVRQALETLEYLFVNYKTKIHGALDGGSQVFPRDMTNIVVDDYLLGDITFFKIINHKKIIHSALDARERIFPRDITNLIVDGYLFGDSLFFNKPTIDNEQAEITEEYKKLNSI